MVANYWSKVLDGRVGRRRALVASGGIALGAAILSGCGGGTDKGPVDRSGLLASLTDTSAKAVPGGIWPLHKTGGAQAIDPVTAFNAVTYTEIGPVYSTLVRYGRGTDGRIPGPDTITGEAAQSWEISPDALQITYKLRPNFKFDRRPPTNGRPMNAADVKYSWERTVALSPFIGELLHSRNEAAPVESLSTPDAQTVVIKQAYPYGGLNNDLAHYYFYVTPVEAEDKFNIKSEARGSGPFFLQKWEPGRIYEFRKNPDWYEKGRPFLDGVDKIILPEPAAALAQFESKAFWTYKDISQEVVLRTKRDHPEMDLFVHPRLGMPGGNFWAFSQREGDAFRDVRFRRAVSMLIDRELFIDTLSNVPQFRNAGLPVGTEWENHISTKAFNWIDPRDRNFGEGGKYFQYNVPEAKKLIAATGLSGTVDFGFRNQAGNFTDIATITAEMLQSDGALKLKIIPLEINTSWLQQRASGGELYNGIIFNTGRGTSDETLLTDKYTPAGTNTISKKPVPGITDAVFKIRAELDFRKRNDMIKQLQRELALLMPDVPIESGLGGFHLKWPWLKNYGVFAAAGFQPEQGASSARLWTEYWYDATARA